MANLALSVAPGYYLEAQNASWVLGANVDFVSFTEDGPTPTVSKYIAYDTLVPPNPFIAVTQDGTGNVVYDGGFPKFYNNVAPALGTPFASLGAQWKYLYNALNFCANPTKVAAGNKKVLVLGDVISTGSYPVKGTGTNGFFTAMTNICSIAGYTPTFKDVSDYAGGTVLNPTLAELNEYCCVLFFSTAYNSLNTDLITESAITDFATYRQQGNGITFITDHGSTPFTDISQIRLHPQGTGFYATANRIMANFGAFFSGDYNRTPVNVGFIRSTYGDHPLYAGMLDTENIAAGGSESKIILPNFTKYTQANIPNVSIANNGVNSIKAIAMMNDGTVETYNFVYVIATGQLLKITDANGVEINSLPSGFRVSRTFNVEVIGAGLGSIVGDILLNGRRVAELSYSEALGSVEAWYVGGSQFIPVRNGDLYEIRITSPFTFSRQLPVTRNHPGVAITARLAMKIKIMKDNGLSGSHPNAVIRDALAQMNLDYSHLQNYLHGDSASNLKVLYKYFAGELDLAPMSVYAYPSVALAADAMSRLVPPSQAAIFNTWDRFVNNEYFPGGVGATGEAAGWVWDAAKQAAVMPLNTGGWVGFVSPDLVDNYVLDVVIKSDNADDDNNGLILAFNRVASVNNRLIINAQRGGGLNPTFSHGVYVNTTLPAIAQSDFAGHQAPNAGDGWSGRFTRIRVTRTGDNFKVECSPWNSMLFDPAGTFTFTLNDRPDLAQFKGRKAYGLINQSQSQTYFTTLSFKGGQLYDIVVDASSNKVYRYSNGAWSLLTGLDVRDVFSAPRTLVNSETDASFKVNLDGSITPL
jgi:hypothetical protein